ncbi:hypothetical protein L195_g007893 [Trifolium pratense]|uniref:Uncharacterized protein n=1 Tax=Trifolium pratense TaxID=57577 RepID=A0A2K3P7N6_TRIPR|nr:hypothetical protein L195_g007893 [Trifolium pratense]
MVGKGGCLMRNVSEMARQTYCFLEEFDSPPPENSPAMVLTETLALGGSSLPSGGSRCSRLGTFGTTIRPCAASSINFLK